MPTILESKLQRILDEKESKVLPENIKEGTNIFGVEGTAKTTKAKITNAMYLFYGKARIDYMDEILELCENVTSAYYMFYNSDLETINLSKFDASNITNMNNMFYYNTSLKTIILGDFDTGQVTDMTNMFSNCTALTSLDVSSFNTINVTKMDSMFSACKVLVVLDLGSFDTRNVTSMTSMFNNCTELASLNVSSFNTTNLTNTNNMFYGCKALTTLDLSKWDMGKVFSVGSMFGACSNLTNLKSFKNLGKGYVKETTNYSNYKLTLSSSNNLTHDSLMSVINNLYDLNLTYNVAGGGTKYTQSLVIGSTNKGKLTSSEIAIATAKGWSVS